MKKQGTVLFATLVIITAISGAVSIYLTLVQHSMERVNAKDAINQTIILVKDSETLLKTETARIGNAIDLSSYYGFPKKLNFDNKGLSVSFTTKPKFVYLNLSKITFEGNNTTVYKILEEILRTREVREIGTFMHIVQDSLDGDDEPRESDSEIARDEPFFQNGILGSFEQWHVIINRYVALTHDPTPLSIPWEKLIIFEPEETQEKIDLSFVHFVDPELLSGVCMGDRVYAQGLQSEAPYKKLEGEDLRRINERCRGFFIQFGDNNYKMKVDMEYQGGGIKDSVRFDYDFTTKKVSHLEHR